ncbi:MAG: acyl carrier protein [Bacteroidales bacterium]
MSLENFISRIEEEFEDNEIGTITADSKFKDELGWSSVNALIMITLIDSEYEVTINADDLKKTDTIGDLYELIQSRSSN